MTESVANAVFLRSRAGMEEELAGRLRRPSWRPFGSRVISMILHAPADPLFRSFTGYESQEFRQKRNESYPPPFRCGRRNPFGRESRCLNVQGDDRLHRLKVNCSRSCEPLPKYDHTTTNRTEPPLMFTQNSVLTNRQQAGNDNNGGFQCDSSEISCECIGITTCKPN